MYTILLVIHTIVVLFLIVVVLIQRSDSDGLGGLSGGSSSSGNNLMTGRAAATLMTRTTAILGAVFMISSLVLAILVSRMTQSSIVDAVPVQEQVAPLPVDTLKDKAAPASKQPAVPAVPKPE